MLKKNKKILITIGVVIAAAISIYIWFSGGDKESYVCPIREEVPQIEEAVSLNWITQEFSAKNAKLYSLEFIFGNIADEEGFLRCDISHGDRNIYRSTIPLKSLQNDTWYRLYCNLNIIPDDTYSVTVSAENCQTKPEIYLISYNDLLMENTKCKVNGVEQNGNWLMGYGYLKRPELLDRIIEVFFCFFYLVMYITIIIFWDRIKSLACKLWHKSIIRQLWRKYFRAFIFWELLLAYVMLNNLKVEIQSSTKVFIYGISIIAGLNIESIRKFGRQIYENDKRTFIKLAAGAFFGGFALVGSQTFIYPLDIKVIWTSIVYFLLVVLWVFPLIILFTRLLEHIPLHSSKQLSVSRFCIASCLLLIVPSLFALYAYNPGISSIDSVRCLDFAHHLRGMKNWHPPFYCMLLRMIITIWDSTYAVIIVQILFWGYVWIEALLFLQGRGMNQYILLLFSFMIGVNPASYTQLCTIWKDIPYSIALLWMTVICAKIVLDSNKMNWYTYLEFIISSIFIFFIRQNGMVVYAITFLGLGILLWNNKKVIISICISVMLVLFIKYPLYSYIDVQSTGGGIYIGLSQDILGVYYNEGNVSDDTMEMISVLTSNDIGQYNYDPYWANSSYDLDVSIISFLRSYINTFINNPQIMLREILCRQDGIWNIFGGQDATLGCVNWVGTVDGLEISNIIEEWNSYYPERRTNEYTWKFNRFGLIFVNNQLLNMISWKTGIYTLLIVWTFLILLSMKKNYHWGLIFLPFFSQILSLILSTGWSEFRYYWPLNLMAIFILLLTPTLKNYE